MEHIDNLKMPIGFYNGVIVTMNNQDLMYANREPGTTPLNPVERDNLLQNVVELYNAAPNGIQSFSVSFFFLTAQLMEFISVDINLLDDEDRRAWHRIDDLINDHSITEVMETVQHWASLYENQHVGVEHTEQDKFGLLESFYKEKLRETFYK